MKVKVDDRKPGHCCLVMQAVDAAKKYAPHLTVDLHING
jgi:hypothetical protein